VVDITITNGAFSRVAVANAILTGNFARYFNGALLSLFKFI
jgi:hypothetical protein